MILIDDETQFKFVMLNIIKNNDFLYSMKMNLFHRLKILKHFFAFFNIQYCMMNSLNDMIFWLFYNEKFKNDSEIDIIFKFISQSIIVYENLKWKFEFFVMLLDVEKQTEINVNQSKFNFVNASMIMNLMMNLMQKKIVNFVQLLILTFYRV